MNFDMNTVWSRGIELVRDNFQLLIVIAGVLLMLPTIAIYLLIPDIQAFADPTADPDMIAERMGAMVGPLIFGGTISAIFQFAGYGALLALMGDTRPTVGQALITGFKIVPSTLVIMVLFLVGYVIGGLVMMIPFTMLAAITGSPALSIIGIIPVLIFIIWLVARMSMSMPALVLGDTLNPFKAVALSFKLTRPKQWMILLFWFVLMLVFFIISLLFNGIFGVIGSLLGTGTAAMLIVGLANGVTTMVSGMIICGVSVAMFTQLSGASTASIEETFE